MTPPDPAENRAEAAGHVETHSSVLFFLADRVYKFRKPVDLGFLDYRDIGSRQHSADEEVRLNRRIAPDVYLSSARVTGPGLEPEPVVVMRRLPDRLRLSELLRTAADSPTVTSGLRQLARLVAAFHATCETSPEIAAAGSSERIDELWAANLAALKEFAPGLVDPHRLDGVGQLYQEYVDGRRSLFSRRQSRGQVRDGHGDLLADDIFLLPDGPQVLDCLDFDPQLRYGDVLNDVAFLAMDLERLGHPDAARTFLSAYAEFSAEHHPRSLEHFYVAYRASVRAKVTCLRWAQTPPPDPARAEHAALAARLIELCHHHLQAAEVTLLLLGGLPGTGKSTVAQAISDGDRDRDWTILSSDVVRKEISGLASTASASAPFGEGIYTAHRTRETYLELFRRAEAALSLGENVVLDASFIDEAQRSAARALAVRTRAHVLEIQCDAPAETIERRLISRAGTVSASDADRHIYDRMHRHCDPWPTAVRLETDVDRTTLGERACRALHGGVHGGVHGGLNGSDV